MPTTAKTSPFRLLFHSLLLVSTLVGDVEAAIGSSTRINKCRVKRREGQLFASPPPGQSTSASTSSSASAPAAPSLTSTGTVAAAPNSTAAAQTYLPQFDYSNQKVRGVNLGGWFMMEPWITPSMFEKTGNDGIVDEYTFGQYQDRGAATAALEEHWATWYTERDFIEMASYGLNHARLPISYWSVPVSQDIGSYVPGAWPYILQALDWAADHGINIILDLHGAPGSQNGFDNSGQRTGDPQWGGNQDYLDRTLKVIETIASQVGDKVSVIELLNEVAGFRGGQWSDSARAYWLAGYDRVRQAAGDKVRVMIGDAFLGLDYWNGFMKDKQGTLMDLHVYQIFSVDELRRSWDDHITYMCNRIPEFTNYAHNNLWLVMGEWSNAVTDCAKYLNGRGVGARWDGTYFNSGNALGSCQGMTGSASSFSQDYKNFLRKYWEAQVNVAERATGWIYWTWKAENADDWSYKAGVENGFIPKDPNERIYPNICG